MTTLEPYKIALQFTLKWEGGIGHPADLAGPVNRGISQDTYDLYRRQKGLSTRPVNQLTDEEVENLYQEMYWKASKADTLALPLAVVHFDTSVNFSVNRSIRFLQEVLGLSNPDGIFGPKTAAAVQAQNPVEVAKRYCQARMDFRHQRVKKNPSQEIFLQGWLRRDRGLLEYVNQFGNSGENSPKSESSQVIIPETTVSGNPNHNPDLIVTKLEQAITLLQEVVTLLKQPK